MKDIDMPHDDTLVQPQPFGFGELFRLKNFYSRQRYWATGLAAFVGSLLASLVLGMLTAVVPPLLVISIGVSVALGWIMFATAVKRLRDADVSLWWVLLNFVPVVNFVSIIVFGCIAPSPTKNRKSAKALIITAIAVMLALVVLPTLIIVLVGWQLINNTKDYNRAAEHANQSAVSATALLEGLPAEVTPSLPQAEPVWTDNAMPAVVKEPAAQ